jgi:2-dehydro-3-deoxyphosphogluconate aldolase/(4S)-4-hydroxy-2-oxoglutarate aldolase
MARHARLDVYRTILDTKLVATFHDERLETAERIACALLDGGVRALEFLARSDAALGVFRELVGRVRARDGAALLGVGSIVDPATAALYLAAGADFVVSPLLAPDVVATCHRHQVAILPPTIDHRDVLARERAERHHAITVLTSRARRTISSAP